MKLRDHFKYRINRILSYYFLDFYPIERIHLWKNLIKNELINPFSKKRIDCELEKYNGPLEIKVISLEHRNDRRIHIINELHKHGLIFQFFNAVNGSSISFRDLQFLTKSSIKNLSDGSKGCAISHMKLWKQISTQDTRKLFLIFEDDVLLDESFQKKIRNLLLTIPVDFDLIYLGGFNNRGRDIEYFVSNHLFRSFNPRRGLYSYILNPKSASKLLDLVSTVNLRYGGIDTIIGKLTRQGKLITYQVFPSIVDINYNLPSNIFNYSIRNKKALENQQVF